MFLAGCALSIAMAATTVPPGHWVEDHTQPYHWAQPEIRPFERHGEDLDRRMSWNAYNRELKDLFRTYRASGSTPLAGRVYKQAAGQAKRRYVYGDIYYSPLVNPYFFDP